MSSPNTVTLPQPGSEAINGVISSAIAGPNEEIVFSLAAANHGAACRFGPYHQGFVDRYDASGNNLGGTWYGGFSFDRCEVDPGGTDRHLRLASTNTGSTATAEAQRLGARDSPGARRGTAASRLVALSRSHASARSGGIVTRSQIERGMRWSRGSDCAGHPPHQRASRALPPTACGPPRRRVHPLQVPHVVGRRRDPPACPSVRQRAAMASSSLTPTRGPRGWTSSPRSSTF